MQIFLMKPLFVERQARFTEALSSSVLLWRVLQAFSSMCVKIRSRGEPNLVIVGAKRLWSKSSCWRPISPADSLACVPALPLVERRNLAY